MKHEVPLDHQLCFSLYQAAMAINRAYKPALDGLEITYTQYLVLSTLSEKGPLTIGQVAQHLDLESSTVTPLVKRLEKSGFVTRQRNPDDERQVLVQLTPSGKKMRASANCLGPILLKASAMPVDRLIALNAEVKAFRDAVNKHVASEAEER